MGEVALSAWFKVKLLFKSGQIIELFDDGKLGLVTVTDGLLGRSHPDLTLTLEGLRATPLVVKVKVTVVLSELAAVEIAPCDHLTWIMKPSDLEELCGTSLS